MVIASSVRSLALSHLRIQKSRVRSSWEAASCHFWVIFTTTLAVEMDFGKTGCNSFELAYNPLNELFRFLGIRGCKMQGVLFHVLLQATVSERKQEMIDAFLLISSKQPNNMAMCQFLKPFQNQLFVSKSVLACLSVVYNLESEFRILILELFFSSCLCQDEIELTKEEYIHLAKSTDVDESAPAGLYKRC